MNNFLSPAMNRRLKGLLLLLLLFGTEFARNSEHRDWSLFELVSGDSSSLWEDCEEEADAASFPDTTGDDDAAFQSPFYVDFTGNPACPFISRLFFAAISAAVESSEHRLLGRSSIPLFILHGTFRGALPA
jgi:hypothetical protein